MASMGCRAAARARGAEQAARGVRATRRRAPTAEERQQQQQQQQQQRRRQPRYQPSRSAQQPEPSVLPRAARRRGAQPQSPSALRESLARCAERGDVSSAMWCVSELAGQGELSTAAMNDALRAAKKTKPSDERTAATLLASSTLNLGRHTGRQVRAHAHGGRALALARPWEGDERSVHEAMVCFCRAGRWKTGMALVRKAKEMGLRLSPEATMSLICCLTKANKRAVAWELLMEHADVVRPTTYACNALIKAHAGAGDWQGCMRVRGRMAELGVPLDMYSYTSLLHCLGRPGAFASGAGAGAGAGAYAGGGHDSDGGGGSRKGGGVHAARRQAQRNAAAATAEAAVLFRSLSTLCMPEVDEATREADSWRLPLVEELMAELTASPSLELPNTVHYNTAIRVMAEDGLLGKANALLAEMRARRVLPDIITYTSLLLVCDRAGAWQQALELVEQAKIDGIRLEAPAYNNLVHACVRAGEWRQALAAQEDMQAVGVKRNQLSYLGGLSAATQGDDAEVALSLASAIRSEDWELSPLHYATIVAAFEDTGSWDAATAYLCEAQAQGYLECAMTVSTVDLHSIRQAGCAQTLLRQWLRGLRGHGLVYFNDLPETLTVVTGWGRHSKVIGQSPVKGRICSLLAALDSPFEVPADNPGCLEASGEDVYKWLVQSELHSLLQFVGGDKTKWRRNFAPELLAAKQQEREEQLMTEYTAAERMPQAWESLVRAEATRV